MSALATQGPDVLDVERARELLEKCRDVDTAKEIRDKAAAIERYQRERKGGVASRRAAAEIVTRAELRLGELLASGPKARPGRKGSGTNGSDPEPKAPTLADRGIDKKDAMRWQRAAALAPTVRERVLALSRDKGDAPTTNVLAELAKLPHEAAAALVERVSGGEFKGDMRAALAAYAHEQRQAAHARLSHANAPLDGSLGQFGLIVADPSWQYRSGTTDPERQIEQHYPTMTLEEICALPVRERALDDCVLGLWITEPLLLSHAPRVIEAWGFEHRSGWVWCKDGAPGMGHWSRIDHEHLLICVRGNPPTPLPAMRPSSILRAPKTAHSEKPIEAYQRLERMFPGVRRLEMFARAPRDGWVVWGNQSDGGRDEASEEERAAE